MNLQLGYTVGDGRPFLILTPDGDGDVTIV